MKRKIEKGTTIKRVRPKGCICEVSSDILKLDDILIGCEKGGDRYE